MNDIIIDHMLGFVDETPVFTKKEPRRIVGRDFIKHVDETLKCGNRMPVKFPWKDSPVDIIKCRFEYSDRADLYPASFYTSIRPDELIFLENIEDWVFIQKSIMQEWHAIRREKDKVLKATEFYVYANEEIYEKGFQPALRVEGKNYNVLSVSDGPTISQITVFATRDNSNEVIKWHYENDAEFQYDWQTDAWEGSQTVRVSTDRKTIRDTLNMHIGDDTACIVSGNKLVFDGTWPCVYGDFDVYRFLDGNDPKYFHSTRGTRLRTKKGGGVIELNLDHVRRIHID